MIDNTNLIRKQIAIIRKGSENCLIHLFTGDYIRTTIEKGNKSEHLWFQILQQSVQDPHKFLAKLVNQPVIIKDMLFGDEMEISFTHIEDYLPKDYENHKN